jgi:pimeloyl-ACP methyl ester carboxylesterase
MEMLGRDALAVLDAAGVRKTNWCGLSMGGIDGRIRQEPHSGANLTLLDAAHIANVERAGEYTDAMLGFLRK